MLLDSEPWLTASSYSVQWVMAVMVVAIARSHHVEECLSERHWYTVVARVVREGACSVSRAVASCGVVSSV